MAEATFMEARAFCLLWLSEMFPMCLLCSTAVICYFFLSFLLLGIVKVCDWVKKTSYSDCFWKNVENHLSYSIEIMKAFSYFLYFNSCVFGAQMDGKNKQVNSYRCPVGDLQHLLQILGSNFIKTRHIYWLFMKLK